MRAERISFAALGVIFAAITLLAAPTIAQDGDAPAAQTTADPMVPLADLAFMVDPLTKAELIVEADAWLGILQTKVAEISAAEIAVRHTNRQIADTAPAEAAEATEGQAEQKSETLAELTKLREQRTALTDRLNTVLLELEAKGGDRSEYDKYVKAVSGITMDATDVSATWSAIQGWLTSKEGGIRWGINIAKAVGVLIAFWILAAIIASAVRRAIGMARDTSELFRNFMVTFCKRLMLLVGLMVAAQCLEVPLGPALAVVGAAGFVVAFALQGTLSNFASGLMILAHRPFDVGDAVNVAGVAGVVESMNLLSTNIKSFDNQKIIVPNNSIWGGVITNMTGLPIRRVDMVFGIGYADDAERAIAIMEDVIKQHPLVLSDPEPVVKLHELADSSVNFVCRPWSKTSDYWAVYWDVTRTVKERFDAEGISIPFPQRDVHVYNETAGAAGA